MLVSELIREEKRLQQSELLPKKWKIMIFLKDSTTALGVLDFETKEQSKEKIFQLSLWAKKHKEENREPFIVTERGTIKYYDQKFSMPFPILN